MTIPFSGNSVTYTTRSERELWDSLWSDASFISRVLLDAEIRGHPSPTVQRNFPIRYRENSDNRIIKFKFL